MTHNYLDYIHKNLKQILLFLYLIPKYKSILQQVIVLKEISTLFILDFIIIFPCINTLLIIALLLLDYLLTYLENVSIELIYAPYFFSKKNMKNFSE